jgi:hypothetical protein
MPTVTQAKEYGVHISVTVGVPAASQDEAEATVERAVREWLASRMVDGVVNEDVLEVTCCDPGCGDGDQGASS